MGQRTYRLTCEPVGGDVPDARRLCDLLAANTAVMLSRLENASTCFGGLWTVHLSVYGRFDGRIVDATAIDACSGNAEAEQLWLSQLPPPPDN